MTFTLRVDTDSEAFQPDPGPQLCRILRIVADRIETGTDYSHYLTVYDLNGNDVGRWALKETAQG